MSKANCKALAKNESETLSIKPCNENKPFFLAKYDN